MYLSAKLNSYFHKHFLMWNGVYCVCVRVCLRVCVCVSYLENIKQACHVLQILLLVMEAVAVLELISATRTMA